MIISRTPLRISFLGGGTDYPQWYNEHGGAVLGVSINKYCYVILHDGKSHFFFDLPNKSGLASSSAYTVGLLRACTSFDKVTISRLATTWEQDKTNGQVGSQDQYLCAVGGFHHLRFSEQGIRDTVLLPGQVAELQDWLMLFDTHQYRMNGAIIPKQLKEMEEHQKTYFQMKQMVDQGLQAIDKSDWIKFGMILDTAWNIKKEMSSAISTPEIDSIYERAKEAGIIGGKLLGGGGGGFIVFVVEPDKQQGVCDSLKELTYTPFKFEYEGTRILYADSKSE